MNNSSTAGNLPAIERPENEAILNDRRFFGHPRGLGALAAGNLFNSIAWSGVYAILIYYLYSPYTKGLGFSQGQAASMIAAMGACNSMFVILGSWLADRLLGMRKAIIAGNIVKAAAFGILAIPAFSMTQGRIFAFISLILMSLPIMGASNSSLTGQLYRNGDSGRRDAAFTIHTVANNIAGLVTPVVIGFIGQHNYHIGFLISSAAALMYGLTILLTQHKFFGTIGDKPVNPVSVKDLKKISVIAISILVTAVLLITGLVLKKVISFDGIMNIVVTFTFIIPIIFLTNLVRKKDISQADRNRLNPFLKLFLIQIVIALTGTMTSTAIAVFTEAKVNRVLFNITFAPATFTSVSQAYGLILSPVFVWLWTNTKASRVKTTYKFGTGIFLYAFSYIVLAIPVLIGTYDKFSPMWLLGYYFIFGIGDNLTYPIGNSLTARLSPPNYETQMQTAWSQAGTIANGISIILFKIFTTADSQLQLFPIMSAVLFVTGFLVFFLSKRVERDI
ncbi:peptide MFS transporter [Clostridium sp. Marseille-P2415]|uniref:peptide MFS transporter n=1 Tax=Clostridium sp. Marseille-P2415 TaxID=1805471 RepID=UPI0009887FE8|nr:oligopeptide:H+ symporter [Clostridium sp. Marseille-P2415]